MAKDSLKSGLSGVISPNLVTLIIFNKTDAGALVCGGWA